MRLTVFPPLSFFPAQLFPRSAILPLRTQATLAAMDPDERAEREEYDRKNMNKRAGVECSFNNVVSK